MCHNLTATANGGACPRDATYIAEMCGRYGTRSSNVSSNKGNLVQEICEVPTLTFLCSRWTRRSRCWAMSSSSETSCYTVVFEDSSESPSTQELRASLEKGTDEVKIDTLRRIIIATSNGNPQVCFVSAALQHECSQSNSISRHCSCRSYNMSCRQRTNN